MVLAFWFRIPQASIDAAKAAYQAWSDADSASPTGIAPPKMVGRIPLLQFNPADLNYYKTESYVSSSSTSENQQWSWRGLPHCDWISAPTTLIPHNFASWRTTNPFTNPDLTRTVDPSYIAIDIRNDDRKPILVFNFQYDSPADKAITGDYVDQLGATIPHYDAYFVTSPAFFDTPPPNPPTTGDCFPPVTVERSADLYYYQVAPTVGELYTKTIDYAPFEGFDRPLQRFGTLMRSGARTFGDSPRIINNQYSYDPAKISGMEITANHWHQVTFSFNLRRIASKGKLLGNTPPPGFGSLTPGLPNQYPGLDSYGTVQSSAEIFMSLDDVNLTRRQISLFNEDGKDNSFLTQTGYQTYRGGMGNTDLTYPDSHGHYERWITTGAKQPIYEFTPPKLPMSTLYLPGNELTTLHCELAELQGYTDVTADTSIEDIRRLFVTKKGKPVPMGKAAEYFGKEPELKLHGSSNWKKAHNTGTLGEPDPNLRAINETATGKILTYKPNPNLYDDQGKPQ